MINTDTSKIKEPLYRKCSWNLPDVWYLGNGSVCLVELTITSVRIDTCKINNKCFTFFEL